MGRNRCGPGPAVGGVRSCAAIGRLCLSWSFADFGVPPTRPLRLSPAGPSTGQATPPVQAAGPVDISSFELLPGKCAFHRYRHFGNGLAVGHSTANPKSRVLFASDTHCISFRKALPLESLRGAYRLETQMMGPKIRSPEELGSFFVVIGKKRAEGPSPAQCLSLVQFREQCPIIAEVCLRTLRCAGF